MSIRNVVPLGGKRLAWRLLAALGAMATLTLAAFGSFHVTEPFITEPDIPVTSGWPVELLGPRLLELFWRPGRYPGSREYVSDRWTMKDLLVRENRQFFRTVRIVEISDDQFTPRAFGVLDECRI
jgi:hypothetical protein